MTSTDYISNHPVPATLTKLLRQYYNFSEIIDLQPYECDLYKLKNKLLSLKKESFGPTDRIIFFNREPSLYLRQRDNLLWYNLQKVLFDLDISNSFCIVITQHDSREYFNEIYKEITTDEFPIAVFDYWHFSDWMPTPSKDIDLNFNLIEKKYITLNRVRKKHRALVIGYLEHYNIVDQGIVAFNSIITADYVPPKYKPPEKITAFVDPSRAYQYVTTAPFTTLNEDWSTRDKKTQQILESITNRGIQWRYKNFAEPAAVEHLDYAGSANSNLLQQAFLWLATESDAFCPVSFLSGISAKSFYAKRPFVVVSGPYTLKRIQSFGFKTFGDFWDEGYDNELDISKRIEKVMKIVNDIAQLSHTDLLTLANRMVDVLEYNYQHLLKFEDYQHAKLEQQILHNLNPNNDTD